MVDQRRVNWLGW